MLADGHRHPLINKSIVISTSVLIIQISAAHAYEVIWFENEHSWFSSAVPGNAGIML
jgi:hypothetical protein